MAISIENLVQCQSTTVVDGKQCYAKPCTDCFIVRLRDAWGVLIGRYHAHSFVSEEFGRKNHGS